MADHARAEFERARVVLEHVRRPKVAASLTVSDVEAPAPTLGAFFETWQADAASRLAVSTVKHHDGVWRRRLADRFAELPMDRIRPRDVSQWRAETVRAMVLLQAVFIECGEVTANPVRVSASRAGDRTG